MATTSGACPTAKHPGASLTITNSGDSSLPWPGGSGACEAAKSSPGGANCARSWDSQKYLGCGGVWAAARRISRWRKPPRCHSPQCHSPWCPSPWGGPGRPGRWGVNHSLCCRGGDGCCVQVRVGCLSCSFPLFESIFLRHWLLRLLRGFWITQGSFYLWVLYWFYFIHSIMGHHTCCVFATPGMYGTSLWWCWGSINLSSWLKVSWAYTHTRLLRPSTNFRPFLQCILHSSCIVDNDRQDPYLLLRIFIPKEVHLRQLATLPYQTTPSWTPSSSTPKQYNYLKRTEHVDRV